MPVGNGAKTSRNLQNLADSSGSAKPTRQILQRYGQNTPIGRVLESRSKNLPPGTEGVTGFGRALTDHETEKRKVR